MLIARRFAAALAVVGAGVLAYAVPVSASSHPTHESECVDGTHRDNLIAHIEAETGDGTVRGKAPLCEPVDILLSIYKVPDTWDGSGFNGTAVPQHVIQTDRGTLAAGETLTLHVDLPACGNVQADLYYPPEITDVDINGTGPRFIAGFIWSIGGPPGQPAECAPPTSPSPTSPSPTSPSPTSPSPTSPSPTSPSPTSPSPTSPSPTSPSPTSTVPVPTETTTTPPPIGQPIPVPPPAVASVPPPHKLAETGSSSTIPLIGLGAILLGAGIGLSLVGRRRDTA